MSAVFSNMPSRFDTRRLAEWLPILIGLLALYIPTYFSLANNLWTFEDQAHGPIVVIVVLFLAWQKRAYLMLRNASQSSKVLGGFLLVLGLISYVIGRSQDILFLDIGSQILIFAAVILIVCGIKALKGLWFVLFFILFMIPLPGAILDAVTLPMKLAVSNVTEQILFWFNYPIARSGVILQMGQYQLLVADACAGMHTLISLEALGLLYLSLVKHDSLFRNITLATLIIPISFTANVIRVTVLALITYYFGDEVGQGFVHKFAGIVLFIVALSIIMLADSLLQYFVKNKAQLEL
jgi:exosortase B